MVIFRKFLSKHKVIWIEKLTKMATVCPKCVSWRCNQVWRSIGVDTVNYINVFFAVFLPFKTPLSFFSFNLKLTAALQCTDLWDLNSILVSDEFDTPSLSTALQVDVELGELDRTRLYTESK